MALRSGDRHEAVRALPVCRLARVPRCSARSTRVHPRASRPLAATRAGPGRCVCRVARARWRELFTATAVVASREAVSSADQPSRSRRISTARCRCGSNCSAAMKTSSIVSRPTTTSSGSRSLALRPRRARRRGRAVARECQMAQPRFLIRASPSDRSVEKVQAGVRGDAVEPYSCRGPTLKGVPSSPGAEKGLLQEVFGLVIGTRASGSNARAAPGGSGRPDQQTCARPLSASRMLSCLFRRASTRNSSAERDAAR